MKEAKKAAGRGNAQFLQRYGPAKVFISSRANGWQTCPGQRHDLCYCPETQLPIDAHRISPVESYCMPRQQRRRTLERLEARQLLAADISLVADLNATVLGAAADPRDFVQLNGTVYFSAASAASGRELWRTDGTAEGTSIVRDIAPGVDSSSPGSLRNIEGTLYFTATDSAHGRELWRSDGTAAGTKIVRDIGPGRSCGVEYSEAIVKSGWNIYFAANDGVHGEELWKTNGTWNGTAPVADIHPTASSQPHDLTQFQGTLAFVATDGANGSRLWRTNGSTVGTKLIDSSLKASGPAQLVDVSGQLFFSAFDAGFGNELWRSDGTAAGTQRVNEIVSGPRSSSPASLVNLNGKLAFTAVEYQKDGGVFLSPERQLWASDGTAEGTQRVVQINPSTAGSDPSKLTNIGGTLYFSAYEPVAGREV
jgi:ELWxxDGT repeat protein